MSEPVLQVKGLKTYYYTEEGVVPAVDGLDFEVEPGETFAIVGESGCGKSVTSLSILRLIPSPPGKIIDGEIIYHGQDLVKKSEREMRSIRGNDISMIFQEPMTSLNPVFTVGQQIGESFRFHQQMGKAEMLKKSIEMLRLVGIPEPLIVHHMGNKEERRARVLQLMHDVGLREEVYTRYPHEFSGGQRQRIGVARALALDPKLVVCDEPVSALDVSIQAQILNLMRELQRKYQLTYIFISHNLSVVKHICDRIAVMYLGNIVEIAPKKELFDNPLHPYTKALLGAIPIPDPDIPAMQDMLEGDVPSPINPPKGCCFHTRCHGCCKECTAQKPKLINVGNDHWVACCKV